MRIGKNRATLLEHCARTDPVYQRAPVYLITASLRAVFACLRCARWMPRGLQVLNGQHGSCPTGHMGKVTIGTVRNANATSRPDRAHAVTA